jgi:hypothetical protein
VRIYKLVELNENRRRDFNQLVQKKDKVKSFFYGKSKPREFNLGDFLLMWDRKIDKQGNHGKFHSFWKGHFQVESIFGTNYSHLSHLDKEDIQFHVNGKSLNMYYYNGT